MHDHFRLISIPKQDQATLSLGFGVVFRYIGVDGWGGVGVGEKFIFVFFL